MVRPVNDAEILDRLNGVFRDVFDQPEMTVSPSTTADQVPGWDSLMNVRLFVSTEMEFGTRFHTAEITTLRHVGDLVTRIKAKTA